jgi:hypothetical protein
MTRFVLILFALLPTVALAQRTGDERVSAPIAFFDDATVIGRGMLNVSLDFGYGSVLAGHDTSFPSSYVTLGLTDRLHVTGGTGYVRTVYEDTHVNGISDTYVGLKAILLPESERLPGVAVKPSLEVLGEPSVHNNPLAPSRANFLIPVMVGKTFETWRTYYTTGYLTRGIVFHALAWEWNGFSRVTPTIVVSHGRIIKDTDFIAELLLNQSRSDVLVGAGFYVKPGWGAYANVSRSVGRSDPNMLRYQISAGLSYSLRLWGEP